MMNLLSQASINKPRYQLYTGPTAPAEAEDNAFEMPASRVSATTQGQAEDLLSSSHQQSTSLLDEDIPSDVAAKLAPVGSLNASHQKAPSSNSDPQHDAWSNRCPPMDRLCSHAATPNGSPGFESLLKHLPPGHWAIADYTQNQGIHYAATFDASGISSLPRSATYDARGVAMPDSAVGYYPWMTQAGSDLDTVEPQVHQMSPEDSYLQIMANREEYDWGPAPQGSLTVGNLTLDSQTVRSMSPEDLCSQVMARLEEDNDPWKA